MFEVAGEPSAGALRAARGQTPKARTLRFRAGRSGHVLLTLQRANRELVDAATRQQIVDRPRTRGDCEGHSGPCPWVSCKHHLYLDVNPVTGTIKLNFPDLEPDDLEHACSLDVADNGPLTLEAVGRLMNLTRERTRQVEVGAMHRLAVTGRP